MLPHRRNVRLVMACLAISILVATYLLQRIDYSAWLGISTPKGKFIFNKSFRFLLNDFACLMLIAAIFDKGNYLKISAWVFLVEFLVLLPLYFVLKLSLEGISEISSPLLSQLHRMIVNPLLMVALLMGFLYQKYFWTKKEGSV